MFFQHLNAYEGTLRRKISSCDPDALAPPHDLLLDRFPEWTLAHWCIVIAAISFVLLMLMPDGRLIDYDVPSGAETVLVARSLASYGTFANPFASLKTGLTAHVAPVYPFLYSLILRVFGTGHSALQFAWICNISFFALQMGLMPLLSYRLDIGVMSGIVAALLGTVSIYTPIDTRWECLLTGLFLVLTFLATETTLRSQSVKASLGTGALWGLLILTNPVVLLLLFAWPVYWIWELRKKIHKKLIKSLAITAVTALLVVTPWIVRNYVRFGTFVFVRDCLGIQLQHGNNDCAASTLQEMIQSGCHALSGANLSAAIAANLATAGEVQFNRVKLHEALHWMASNPRGFAVLTLQRFRLFWFPDLDSFWQTALVWAITLLSLIGLRLMFRNGLGASVIASTWLLFPLMYYISPFEPRYRYPILWTSLLPAGYALVEISRLPFFHSSLRKSAR